jgi:RNA polymerase sigma factor for flagellar operon FliA
VALEGELLRAPTDVEISERTGFSEAELGSLRALYAQSLVVRLDDFVPGDGGATFGELVEDDSQNPRRQIEGRVIRTALAECLEKLEHREREVLRLHYFDCLTFSEIGKVIGVSESRSHQIHTRALARLRESFLTQISVPA